MNKDASLEQLLKEHKISQRTYDKVIVAKKYIERRYNLKTVKNLEWNEIINRIDSLTICDKEKQKIKKEIYKQEMIKSRKSREKQSIRDYESLAIIGRGAFGEVHVCREKKTDKIYAIKKIKKDVLILKNQIIHILNEQIFMSRAKSPWIVELKASFQEDDYLYLVMEYLPGGDLMNLLIKRDILTEDEARFYISELILAIESIHKLDCIHRDIKPDNVLIDKYGHIKLSDFGLAKISDKLYDNEKENAKYYLNNQKNNNNNEEKMTHNKNFSCVGTAYYVAPEVLNKNGYYKEIDWWSVGVIFYEMLVGYAPFCSKETSEVCYKVLNWKKFLKIPSKINISEEAKDLIFKMISNSNNRLGKNGADEIKKHPFFNGIDWDNIRNSKPPFVPILKNEYDTSYFEKFEISEPFYPKTVNKFKRKDIEYIGYTFKEDFFNNNDLKQEYENAVKTVNENTQKENKKYSNDSCLYNKELESSKENININNIYYLINKNTYSANTSYNTNISYNNNSANNNNYNCVNKKNQKQNPIKEVIINKDISKIPFRRASMNKQGGGGGKIPTSVHLKSLKGYSINNCCRYKESFTKNNQSTIPISNYNNYNKQKLNIIQLPLKKTKPKIYYSNKIMNILNSSISQENTINTIDDIYNTNNTNNTYRSVNMNTNSNTYKNIDFNRVKNSYLINNKMKKHLNNALLYNSKNKTKKLNITPICKNVKKRLSPQPKDKVFIKKYFVNKKLSKDKYNMGNITCRNNSPANYRIKEKKLIVKSCSSNCMESKKTINISRENIRKNILLNTNTPNSANNANNQFYINPLKNLRPLATQRNKIAYIYKKKK
jgi:serine/threonine kinase 38